MIMHGDGYSVVPLFSKTLYTTNCEPNDEIKRVINDFIKNSDWHKNDEHGPVTTYRTKNLYVLNEPELKLLKDMILERFNNFKNNVLQYNENEFKLTTSWITATHRYNYCNYHNHNHSMYTGVLYFDQLPEQGGISLMNFERQTFDPIVSENNLYNSKEWIINPSPWQLLFFPSEVHHKILENKNKKSRYTMAFNFYPIGDLGSGDSHIKIEKVGDLYGIH